MYWVEGRVESAAGRRAARKSVVKFLFSRLWTANDGRLYCFAADTCTAPSRQGTQEAVAMGVTREEYVPPSMMHTFTCTAHQSYTHACISTRVVISPQQTMMAHAAPQCFLSVACAARAVHTQAHMQQARTDTSADARLPMHRGAHMLKHARTPRNEHLSHNAQFTGSLVQVCLLRISSRNGGPPWRSLSTGVYLLCALCIMIERQHD